MSSAKWQVFLGVIMLKLWVRNIVSVKRPNDTQVFVDKDPTIYATVILISKYTNPIYNKTGYLMILLLLIYQLVTWENADCTYICICI